MGLIAASDRQIARFVWKLWVTAEILALYAWVRLALRGDDIRTILTSLRHRDAALARPDPRAHEYALRLGRAVHRVLEHAPRRSRCLIESLVLTRMLARRHLDCSLVIGVAPGGTFQAHAWVESDGVALLPSLTSTFTPLVRI